MTQREEIVGEVATRIAGLHLQHPVRVAIDGVDAAGKTILADELRQAIERLDRTLRRAEQRDIELFGSVEEVRDRYRQRYIPGQQLYFRSAQPERRASVIVDNNDPMKPRIAGVL